MNRREPFEHSHPFTPPPPRCACKRTHDHRMFSLAGRAHNGAGGRWAGCIRRARVHNINRIRCYCLDVVKIIDAPAHAARVAAAGTCGMCLIAERARLRWIPQSGHTRSGCTHTRGRARLVAPRLPRYLGCPHDAPMALGIQPQLPESPPLAVMRAACLPLLVGVLARVWVPAKVGHRAVKFLMAFQFVGLLGYLVSLPFSPVRTRAPRRLSLVPVSISTLLYRSTRPCRRAE